MIHPEKSPIAGQTVKIKQDANELGGNDILIEDWWDRVADKSWMDSHGNPAALNFAMRSGFSETIRIPIDNEVVYGKINGIGYLVHVIELEENIPGLHKTVLST